MLQNILLNAMGKNIPTKKSDSGLKTTLKKGISKSQDANVHSMWKGYTCKLDITKIFFLMKQHVNKNAWLCMGGCKD